MLEAKTGWLLPSGQVHCVLSVSMADHCSCLLDTGPENPVGFLRLLFKRPACFLKAYIFHLLKAMISGRLCTEGGAFSN